MFKIWCKKDNHWILIMTCSDLYTSVLNIRILRELGNEVIQSQNNPNK